MRDRDAGEKVKASDILKHAQDVRDLSALLTEGEAIALPTRVYHDLDELLGKAQADMARGTTDAAVATAVGRIRAAFTRAADSSS